MAGRKNQGIIITLTRENTNSCILLFSWLTSQINRISCHMHSKATLQLLIRYHILEIYNGVSTLQIRKTDFWGWGGGGRGSMLHDRNVQYYRACDNLVRITKVYL